MSLVMGVLRLKGDLKASRHLTEEEKTPKLQLKEKMQTVAYIMGYARRLGFGSLVWYQRKIVLDAGEFTPLYQGRS